jgi:hypothetical protein
MKKKNSGTGAVITWILFLVLISSILLTLQLIKSKKAPVLVKNEITSPIVPSPEPEKTPEIQIAPKVETPEIKAEKNQEIYAMALKDPKVSTCEKLTDAVLKQDCMDRSYLKQAAATPTKETCAKISEAGLKENCIAGVLIALAPTATSTSFCLEIKDKTYRAACTDQITLNKALTSRDDSLCAALSSASLKASCLSAIESYKAYEK